MKMPFGDLMKQAQEMQQRMQAAQAELAALEVHGEAGAGMVKVVMTGRHDVRRIVIDASLQGESLDVLGDLVAAAVNDAVRRVETAQRDKLGALTGGINIPGLQL